MTNIAFTLPYVDAAQIAASTSAQSGMDSDAAPAPGVPVC